MKKIILITLYILSLTIGHVLYAQTKDYTTLAPLPSTTKSCTGSTCTADINSYLSGFLNLTITIGAVLAMIYIGLYGFQYAMSDSAPKKSEYKDKLWTILQGLLLVISAYAIMYTINPELVNVNLNLESPKLQAVRPVNSTGTVVGGTAITYDPCLSCTTATINGVTVQVNSSFMNQLQTLNQTSKITVTESWPPTRNHGDPCHKNGTCVDAVPYNRDVSPANALKLIMDARKTGAGAVFESSNRDSVQQLKAQLKAAGLSESYALYLPPCTESSTPGTCITGTHFSIYNTLKYN